MNRCIDQSKSHLTATSARQWASALHGLAGLLLLGFTASHGAFLAVADPRQGLPNTVFPFLCNWSVYLLAGLTELCVGLAGLRWRGQPWVNGLILTLVAELLCYRWALRFTGGIGCNCLALLGRLLGISRAQETALSLFFLGVLVLTTIPGLLELGRRRWRARSTLIPALVLLSCSGSLLAEPGLRVWGTVSLREFNPRTGEPYPQQQWHNTFVVTLWERTWEVRVTNQHRAHWWGVRAFDGTNSYALRPAGGAFVAGHPEQPATNRAQATVIRSPYPVPLGSVLGEAMVSLTYGWSPETFQTNRAGDVVMPIPWTVVRRNPDAWGFRWKVFGWEDGRFLRAFDVVRDSRLDLPTRQELFRWEIDYPDTLADYNAYLSALNARKSRPDGSLRGRYAVTEWYRAEGRTFPRAARLEVFSIMDTNHPSRIFELEAAGFEGLKSPPVTPPAIAVSTQVSDYRYKRWNSRRIYKFAPYTLEPGESWPGDRDSALLAAAEDWLKRGRPFTRFADDHKRWFAWMLLGLVLGPMVIWGVRRKRQNKPQSKEVL